jgi:hypothetical protein
MASIHADISVLPMTERERAYVRAALSYACSNFDDLMEAYPSELPKGDEHIFERLLAVMDTTPVLTWTDHGSYQEAKIGSGDDYVSFCLSGRVTCYRRGPWRLLIEVCEGEHHIDWGCFDSQDQPTRYYHSEGIAKAEADAIARVLLEDRKQVDKKKGK